MRKWIVVALVLALALAVVPLALAHPGGGLAKGKAKFCLVGTVVAVDQAADPDTLTVKVKAGTRSIRGWVRPVGAWRGTEMTLNVDPTAKIRLVTDEGCVAATLDQLLAGARVKVRGTIAVDSTDPNNIVRTFTAKFVKAKLAPVPPTP